MRQLWWWYDKRHTLNPQNPQNSVLLHIFCATCAFIKICWKIVRQHYFSCFLTKKKYLHTLGTVLKQYFMFFLVFSNLPTETAFFAFFVLIQILPYAYPLCRRSRKCFKKPLVDILFHIWCYHNHIWTKQVSKHSNWIDEKFENFEIQKYWKTPNVLIFGIFYRSAKNWVSLREKILVFNTS